MRFYNKVRSIITLAGVLVSSIALSSELPKYSVYDTPSRMVLSDKGDKIAVLEGKRRISVFSTKNGKRISIIKLPSSTNDLTFSPSGHRLMTGDDDNTRKIWNANNGKLINTLKGQKGDVNSVDYSPNGKRAAAASEDRTIRVWDPIVVKGIRTIKTKERPKDIRFLNNNRDILVSTYNGLEIWNTSTGKKLASFGNTPGYRRISLNRSATVVLATPEGRMDENIEVWDLKTKKQLHLLKGHRYQVDQMLFSKDEKSIVSVSHDDTVKVWDAMTGANLHTIKNQAGTPHTLVMDNNPQHFWIGDKRTVKKIELASLDMSFRNQFVKEKNKSDSAETAFATYKKYQGRLLYPKNLRANKSLLDFAFQSERKSAVESQSYKNMFQVFSKYKPEYSSTEDEKTLGELYRTAMKTNFSQVMETESAEKMLETYKSYAKLNYKGKESEALKQFFKQALNWTLAQPDMTKQSRVEMYNQWVSEIPLLHSDVTVDSLREFANVDIRHVFKEGKIGKRYVPMLSHSTSNTKTRYINGNPINETTYDSYTSGGHSESRYGYTSVYQMFNESDGYYLVDLEVNATSSFTNYKTGKSWGGDEYKTSESKENRISQTTQYLLRPKAQVKDQLIVGEKIPKDFHLKVGRVKLLDKKWVTGLDQALKGNKLKQTQEYMQLDDAYNWLPELGSVFAGKAFRKITSDVSTGERFDKDFQSEVNVQFNNNNEVAVLVTYDTNFDSESHSIKVPAGQSVTQKVMAKGTSKKNLKLDLLMIEPVR